jgi:hypothetical protein
VLIEVKISDSKPSPALKKLQADLNIPAVQLVWTAKAINSFLIKAGKFSSHPHINGSANCRSLTKAG